MCLGGALLLASHLPPIKSTLMYRIWSLTGKKKNNNKNTVVETHEMMRLLDITFFFREIA